MIVVFLLYRWGWWGSEGAKTHLSNSMELNLWSEPKPGVVALCPSATPNLQNPRHREGQARQKLLSAPPSSLTLPCLLLPSSISVLLISVLPPEIILHSSFLPILTNLWSIRGHVVITESKKGALRKKTFLQHNCGVQGWQEPLRLSHDTV